MEGHEFKKLRLQLQLTQRELAEQFDINVRTLSRYEQNASPIPRIVEYALTHLLKRNK